MSEIQDIETLAVWQTESPAGGSVPYFTGFGKHLTTDRPSHTVWRHPVEVSRETDSVLLSFEGMQCEADVMVDGANVGRVDQFSWVLDISSYVTPGTSSELTVHLHKRHYEEPSGTVRLMKGRRLPSWKLRGLTEGSLLSTAQMARPSMIKCDLPLSLDPGQMCWIEASSVPEALGDHSVKVIGNNCKVTCFFNGTICGRLFLATEDAPIARGKSQPSEAFALGYLPGCWSRGRDNQILFFVEAVGNESAEIEAIEVISI